MDFPVIHTADVMLVLHCSSKQISMVLKL